MTRRILPGATAAAAAALALTLTATSANALTLTVGGAPVSNQGEALGALAKAADAIRDNGATITAGGYKVVAMRAKAPVQSLPQYDEQLAKVASDLGRPLDGGFPSSGQPGQGY